MTAIGTAGTGAASAVESEVTRLTPAGADAAPEAARRIWAEAAAPARPAPPSTATGGGAGAAERSATAYATSSSSRGSDTRNSSPSASAGAPRTRIHRVVSSAMARRHRASVRSACCMAS